MGARTADGALSARSATFLEVLLLCGVPLSLATQVRPFSIGGQAFGPGEFLLVIWAASAWFLTPARACRGSQTFSKLPLFWFLAFAGLLVGTINALANGVVPPEGTRVHDWAAYLFCAALSVVFIRLLPDTAEARLDFALKFGLALAAPLCILWIAALGMRTAGPLQLWYAFRFIGWAVNPNQTALALILAPFLMFHALEGKFRSGTCPRIHVLGIVAGATLAIGAVWATSSNAGRLALVLALCLQLILTVHQWRVAHDPSAARIARLLLLVIALTLAMDVKVGPETRAMQPEMKLESESVSEVITEPFINKDGGSREIAVRLALMKNGLLAALDSHLLGFGPGCFSGIDGPLLGSEAHNTPIDWLTCAGVAGLVGLALLLAELVLSLWRRRAYSLLAGLIALAAFAQFHYVLRHPLTWIFLAFLEGVARGDRRSGGGSR